MNNLQKLSNKYKTQTPNQRRDAVGEMVSNEAGVAEQHVLNQMRKKGWDAIKNPDATGTDILLRRNGAMIPVEVKFRSGDKPDCGGSENFFFEKATHYTTSYHKTSKTWQEKAPMYITVFEDGTMWCKRYASIRQGVAEDSIPYHMCLTKHDTYGMLVNYKELLNHGMLTIVSSSLI